MSNTINNIMSKIYIDIKNAPLKTIVKNNIFQYLKQYLENCGSQNQIISFYSHPNRKMQWNSLSFQSNFIFNDIMSSMMNLLHGKYEFENNSNILNLKDDIITIEKILKTDGYYISSISQEICKDIIKKLDTVKFQERNTKRIVKYNQNLRSYSSNSAWCTSQSDILNIDEVQKLISDEKLLSIIQNYLNAKPVLTQTNLWFSQNINTDYSTNAQLFHRDFDHERWLKVFIYLNDVTEKNGPHLFVKGSHSNIGTIGREAFVRETDKTIKMHYSENDIIMHKGKQGTIVIEDTRGYHKGLPVVEGQRLLLQFEFAINPSYGNVLPPFKINNISSKLRSNMEKYPYIYQNIHINKQE